MTIHDYFRDTEPPECIEIVISFGYTLKCVWKGSLKNVPNMFKNKTAIRRSKSSRIFIYNNSGFTNNEMVSVIMMMENFYNLYRRDIPFV